MASPIITNNRISIFSVCASFVRCCRRAAILPHFHYIPHSTISTFSSPSSPPPVPFFSTNSLFQIGDAFFSKFYFVFSLSHFEIDCYYAMPRRNICALHANVTSLFPLNIVWAFLVRHASSAGGTRYIKITQFGGKFTRVFLFAFVRSMLLFSPVRLFCARPHTPRPPILDKFNEISLSAHSLWLFVDVFLTRSHTHTHARARTRTASRMGREARAEFNDFWWSNWFNQSPELAS